MGIDFAAVGLLVLLPAALALTYLLHFAARRRLSPARARASLALRTVVLGALVFALAGTQLVLPVDRLATVFLVDWSDSVGNAGREASTAFLQDALEELPDGDQAGIVVFGADALVERLPSPTRLLERIDSVPVRSATDIGAALRLANALFPDATQKRIVLLSDGNDTSGRGQAEAALAGSRGIQVETVAIGLGDEPEVLVQSVRTPSLARVGEEIEARVEIRSTVAQTATVRLFQLTDQGSLAVASQAVSLQPGLTSVAFTVAADRAGFHVFRAVVDAARDTFHQNDRADSHTIVKGSPRILVVAGDDAVAANLVLALQRENQDVTVTTPEAVPADPAALALTYDSTVLVDAAAKRFRREQLLALQAYVRDFGRGLVMVGGQDSYGAGGYRDTPLEETLPVTMDVRSREKQPDIALVVVIDKSGSMAACHCNSASRDLGVQIQGVPKVDIGKEAILRAIEALTARDEFGVVAFDENAHVVIRTAPLGSVGDVETQIAGIRPDGQTNIFAGLSEAVASLEKATAERRHIILLTDGWSSAGEYSALLARMKAAGITLSAVGAGGGSADFLRTLAEQGGGKYYNAANPATIPDIFLKETQQVSGQQIVEEAFFPIQTAASPILRGLEAGFPQLLGYNGTTPKGAAQTALVSARSDPLLSQWQYGLGRSVAWTSDASGRWAKNWLAWSGFDRFFSQLVAWTFPGEESGGIEASFVTEAGRTVLRVESSEEDGRPRNFYETSAVLAGGPEVTVRQVRLQQVAPGIYEAPLEDVEAGAYSVRVTQAKPGAPALGRTLGLVADTAAEYRILGTNEGLLAALRTATGGRSLNDPAEVWRHDLASTGAFTDLWPWLLVLALLLWPLDVAVRRVSITQRELADARAWAGARWAAWRGPARRTRAVGEMLAARERAGGAGARAALLRDAAATGGATPDATRATPTSASVAQTGTIVEPVPKPGAPLAPEVGPPDRDTIFRLREAKRRATRR